MKKIILALSIITTFSTANICMAADGQGGIAGTVAVSMGAVGAFIESTSSAVAIGKTTAYTNGLGSATTANAYAAGAGGAIGANKDSAMLTAITLETLTGVIVAQKNSLSKDTIKIDNYGNTADALVGGD